jgi:hypothetical protein
MSDERYCPCGGVILADTEKWAVPLCHECWVPWTRVDIPQLTEELEELRAIPGPVKIYVGDPKYKTKREFVLEQENAALRSLLQEARKHVVWGEGSSGVDELVERIDKAIEND